MIEINLLNKGHGILFKQESIEKNLAYRRSRTFLLLILLLSSLITLYLNQVKPSEFNNPLIADFFKHLDVVWFEEDITPSNARQDGSLSNADIKKNIETGTKRLQTSTFFEKEEDIAPSNARQDRDLSNADIEKNIKTGTKKFQNPAPLEKNEKLPLKATVQEKAFYIKVASTILPESADSIQKDLLAKGFQSTRGTNKGFAKNYFVVLDPVKDLKSAKTILKKIKHLDDNWVVKNIGKKGFQIESQSSIFRKKAEQLEKQIKKKGLKGKVMYKKMPMVFHEVLIGKFNSDKEAIPIVKNIQKAGFKGIVVKR